MSGTISDLGREGAGMLGSTDDNADQQKFQHQVWVGSLCKGNASEGGLALLIR